MNPTAPTRAAPEAWSRASATGAGPGRGGEAGIRERLRATLALGGVIALGTFALGLLVASRAGWVALAGRDLALVLGLSTLVLAALGAVCWVRVGHILRPIRDLADAIGATGEGEMPREVQGAYPAEVGTLADGYNRALRALRASRDELGETIEESMRLRAYLENVVAGMPNAVLILDPEGKVTYWNAAAGREAGIAWDEAMGRDLFTLDAGYGAYRSCFEEVMERGEPKRLRREPFRLPGGETGRRNLTLYPIGEGPARNVVVSSEDITTADRLEKMMIHADKMASVGGLAAGMAHEINNPLAGILSNLQNLERRLDPALPATARRLEEAGLGGETPERLRAFLERQKIPRYVEVIRDCAGRAARIVRSLLDFSHRQEASLAVQAVGPMIENTLFLAQAEYDLDKGRDFRDVEVEVALDDGLPAVHCDRQQIEQVLLNLVKNAAHSILEERSRRPGFVPRLTIAARRRDDFVRIEVTDNGPGIPAEVREHVFEPFTSTKPVGEGTGLGLSISYFIVTEGHGGAMGVEEPDEGGARFLLELPAAGALRERQHRPGPLPGPSPLDRATGDEETWSGAPVRADEPADDTADEGEEA